MDKNDRKELKSMSKKSFIKQEKADIKAAQGSAKKTSKKK